MIIVKNETIEKLQNKILSLLGLENDVILTKEQDIYYYLHDINGDREYSLHLSGLKALADMCALADVNGKPQHKSLLTILNELASVVLYYHYDNETAYEQFLTLHNKYVSRVVKETANYIAPIEQNFNVMDINYYTKPNELPSDLSDAMNSPTLYKAISEVYHKTQEPDYRLDFVYDKVIQTKVENIFNKTKNDIIENVNV